jgi:beta-lactamase regulating signal transducer with metallopeptidase domain
MFNAIQERCNSFAQAWAWWVGMSILDAAVVLAVVSLVWLAIRRKASPQLGYLLFLLVPLKLFVPLHVTVPDRIFSWTPLMAVRGIGQDITPTAPPSAASALKNPINLPARSEYQAASDNRSAQSTQSSAPL